MPIPRFSLLRGAVLTALLILGYANLSAKEDPCTQCPIPCARPQDNTFNVRLTGGRTDPGRQFISVIRDTAHIAGEVVQSYRFFYNDDGACKDTVIQAHHVDALVMGLTLGKVPPLHVPVRPVREYQLDAEPTVQSSFVELSGFLGYGGSDESTATPQQIGFNSFYYGAGLLVAPFGRMLGDKLSLGIGGSALFEGGRLRIPAYGHLRYSFTSTSIANSVEFIPSHCQFACENADADTINVDSTYKQRPGPDSVDPTAALIMKRVANRDETAPYVFVEGGLIFDTGFEGSGADPSINPDDYSQYMAGAGVGIPIIPILHASLGYRFMRLNLRTPCENCQDVFQVNTNIVHSIVLRVALHFGW